MWNRGGGHIATVPPPDRDTSAVRLDLGPGKVASLPREARLGSCDPAGVRPGTYELYVRVVFSPEDDPRAMMESFGGPWPLKVHEPAGEPARCGRFPCSFRSDDVEITGARR